MASRPLGYVTSSVLLGEDFGVGAEAEKDDFSKRFAAAKASCTKGKATEMCWNQFFVIN